MDWVQGSITFLSGATVIGGIAHAVNTFPTPQNKYGAWFIGCIQWVVGQRITAGNTFQGLQTVTKGVTTQEKSEGATLGICRDDSTLGL